MRRLSSCVPVLFAVLLVGACGEPRYTAGRWLAPEASDFAWERAAPAELGLDGRALESLARGLAGDGTRAFLVVRGGRIAAEWNAWNVGPDEPHELAALAKAIVGFPMFALAAGDGVFGLDTPGSRFLPEWADDPLRSRIRMVHLVTHTSGIENVSFPAGARGELSGWADRYYHDHPGRFRMAALEAPVRFEPGTRHAYSGVAYYALAYLLGRALGEDVHFDALLRERVYGPLGIPDRAWSISYGLSYRVEGMQLQALGSGARFTARAVARVASLVMADGVWRGRELLDRALLEELLGGGETEPVSVDHGWWLNRWGLVDSLPRDALIGMGAGGQIALAVPSLDLVAVRLGDALESRGEETPMDTAERCLFRPLLAALDPEATLSPLQP